MGQGQIGGLRELECIAPKSHNHAATKQMKQNWNSGWPELKAHSSNIK